MTDLVVSFPPWLVANYVNVGEELYALPWWAWLRRRNAMHRRQHYAMRLADEVEAVVMTDRFASEEQTAGGGAA